MVTTRPFGKRGWGTSEGLQKGKEREDEEGKRSGRYNIPQKRDDMIYLGGEIFFF